MMLAMAWSPQRLEGAPALWRPFHRSKHVEQVKHLSRTKTIAVKLWKRAHRQAQNLQTLQPNYELGISVSQGVDCHPAVDGYFSSTGEDPVSPLHSCPTDSTTVEWVSSLASE